MKRLESASTEVEADSNKQIKLRNIFKAGLIECAIVSIPASLTFLFSDRLVKQCNTAAWRKALGRAGIENFHWHDLRHTWASWHVQNGTSLQELQQLGGGLRLILFYVMRI